MLATNCPHKTPLLVQLVGVDRQSKQEDIHVHNNIVIKLDNFQFLTNKRDNTSYSQITRTFVGMMTEYLLTNRHFWPSNKESIHVHCTCHTVHVLYLGLFSLSSIHVVDTDKQTVVHDPKALEYFTVSVQCPDQGIELLWCQQHTLKKERRKEGGGLVRQVNGCTVRVHIECNGIDTVP